MTTKSTSKPGAARPGPRPGAPRKKRSPNGSGSLMKTRNVRLPEPTLERASGMAEELGMSFSALASLLVEKFVNGEISIAVEQVQVQLATPTTEE